MIEDHGHDQTDKQKITSSQQCDDEVRGTHEERVDCLEIPQERIAYVRETKEGVKRQRKSVNIRVHSKCKMRPIRIRACQWNKTQAVIFIGKGEEEENKESRHNK